MNLFDLTGKVAIVTGASSGLGADAALAYADAGADLALVARREEKLEETAKKIREKGKKAFVVACDVTNEEPVKLAIEKIIEEYGKIDILLNNAGIAKRGSVDELTVEDWDMSMDVNVKGIFLVSKYVVPHMRDKQYGKIINVASINAILADKPKELWRHSYNASKAAVRGLTMGMAASYMQDNITVNSIGPGLFESEMTEKTLFKNEAFMTMYNGLCPASRPGKRGELNGTLIYLSSDASSYVTSQHIIIAGGFEII